MVSYYENQRIKGLINNEFSKLIKELPEENQNKAEQTREKILFQLEEENNTIQIPSIQIQSTHYLLAGWLIEKDERKSWYLYHAISNLITNPEIQKTLQRTYGQNNYETINRRFKTYSNIIEQIKLDLDQLEDKQDKNADSPSYKRAKNNLMKLPIIYNDLYQIFYIITKNTNLGQATIKNQQFQTMERQLRKIEYKEEQNKDNNLNRPNINPEANQ